MNYRIVIIFASSLLATTLSCSNEKSDSRELDALLSQSNLVVSVINAELGTTNKTTLRALADLLSATNRMRVSSWGNTYPPSIIIIFNGTNVPRGIEYYGNLIFSHRTYYFRVKHTNEIIGLLENPPQTTNMNRTDGRER